MIFVVKFAKTVRTHWKKSIFFTGVGVFGVRYGIEKYSDEMLRRKYCAEAKEYGEQVAQFGEKNRKITVFLNPAASGTDSRKLFEKNAAPLLYLAGLEVTVVKTEYDGQIKEFFRYLEQKHVDGIVVAGGNGSVVETITGMMRKEDREFRQKIPVGIIPTGKTNTFATFFFGPDKERVRRMLDSAMAIVKGATQKLDVLKIQGEDGRTTFALCGLEAGAFRDAKERTSKYWYFGPLKYRFTYLRSTLGKWPPCIRGTLEYVEAKETDVPKIKEKKPQEPPKQQQSWTSWILSFIIGSRKPSKGISEEEEEEEEFENEETLSRDLNTVELTMDSGFTRTKQVLKGVHVGVGMEDITKKDFLSEGWRRLQNPVWAIGSNKNDDILSRKVKFTPEVKEGTSIWYTIDGEHFEAIPVEVTLLKNRLKIFTLDEKLSS